MNDTARLARLPLPLPDELSRPRLLERLNGRWHAPVTVIEAGAGFGKSTLLAQAVRANALEPRGIDVWHACTPGDIDGEVLGQAVLEALGVAGRYHDPAIQIADALAAYSPIDVCVLLDDAHEVRPGSSGGELLDRLVRRLPDNAHLVLAARHAPSVRLSRLRAADRLVEITQDDLLFTRSETATIANRLGRVPDEAISLGGWPALVRLALAVRPEVAIDFAQEEVLCNLSRDQRCALFALSNLGYADRERVGRVVGATVDLAHLAAVVPLVSRTEEGLFRAHDLWTEALLRVLTPEEIGRLRTRVLDELVASGDLPRAGALAMTHEDVDALAQIAVEVVRRTIAALPIDMVRPWCSMLQRNRPAAARRDCSAPRSVRRSTSPIRALTSTSTPRPRTSATAVTPTVRSSRWLSARSGRTCAVMLRDSSNSPVELTPSPAPTTTPRSMWRYEPSLPSARR